MIIFYKGRIGIHILCRKEKKKLFSTTSLEKTKDEQTIKKIKKIANLDAVHKTNKKSSSKS